MVTEDKMFENVITAGYLLGTYSVRTSSQESVSTQQILVNVYGINLILSLLAPVICIWGLFGKFKYPTRVHSWEKFWKFKVPNKCPFVSMDRLTDGHRSDWYTISSPMSLRLRWAKTTQWEQQQTIYKQHQNYNAFNVYRRELAPGTVSLTGDRAQGDDSKHWAYSTT